MSDRPTPETDAYYWCLREQRESLAFARDLERQRDAYAATLRVIAESNDRSHQEAAYSALIRDRHPEIAGNAKPHATGPAGEMP